MTEQHLTSGWWRKKPVIIETFRLGNGTVPLPVPDWFRPDQKDISADGIVIHTLEGDHLARWGDWIIKGVKGELYPCKPDIFAITYEFAERPGEAQAGGAAIDARENAFDDWWHIDEQRDASLRDAFAAGWSAALTPPGCDRGDKG